MRDGFDADVLDEHVRRHPRHASDRKLARVDERNGRAVRVADEDRLANSELEKQFGQEHFRFAVHEVDTDPRLAQHI